MNRVFIVLLAAVVLAGLAVLYLISPPTGKRASRRVIIERGMSFRDIATRLRDEHVVRSASALRVGARIEKCDRDIQAGTYEFGPGLSLLKVLDRLRAGASSAIWLTIPEGLTVREVAALVEGVLPGEGAPYEASARDRILARSLGVTGDPGSRGVVLEGYLFPDTYALAPHTTGEEVVRLQVRTFWSVFDSTRVAESPARGLGVHGVVTLASIVEREARQDVERPRIAAVFMNRIARGMPLQADPTVRYALGEWDRPLTERDLAFASPWNTYRVRGLPPGPIANPGRASLESVLHPTPGSRELYFVARGDGTHEFSLTLQDHARARERIRRTGGSERDLMKSDHRGGVHG